MFDLDVSTLSTLPPAEAVSVLTSHPENQWFERKSGRIAAKDLARPLIAFANAEGGTLVVGINNGKVDGVSATAENALRQAAIDFTNPPVRHQVSTIDADGHTILIFEVEPGNALHVNQAGDAYLRIGDESRKLSLAEQQELAYDAGTQTFEATTVPLTPSDLSQPLLESYRETIGSSSIESMLHARDLVTREGELTVAAELLFDEHPQQDFPSAHIRVLKYDDDERGVGARMTLAEDRRFDGPIPAQINQAAEFIDRLVPARQRLAASGRFERQPLIPRDAWLEGLVNAAIHRSYSMMGDHIRVEIFPHRIEITSPGRFPGIVNLSSPQSIPRYARNPRIARVCSDMGITRELGEGIRRIYEEMASYGLIEPMYRQSSSTVTLVLRAANAVTPEVLKSLPRSAHTVLNVMRAQNRALSTGQVAELAGIARPTARRALLALAEAELVTWEGTSERDPRASWRIA